MYKILSLRATMKIFWVQYSLLCMMLFFLSGCRKTTVSEQACIECVGTSSGYHVESLEKDVSVHIQKLSNKECRRYLKKRRKAVIPLRFTIENRSSRDYLFNPKDMNLPFADFKTVMRSLTSSGKKAYLAFAAIGPVAFGTYLLGATIAFQPATPSLGALMYVGVIAVTACAVLVGGVAVGIIGSAIYAGVKHRKNKKYAAREEQYYLKSLAVPAGKTVSTVLFLKKDTVLPETMKISLRSEQDQEAVILTAVL